MEVRYNYCKRFFFLLFILFINGQVFADDDTASRSHREAFKVQVGDQLDISNKYGQIVVNTWEKDSVAISVMITAYGKTYFEARKILDRVDIDMRKNGQFIRAESIFDRSSGFFTEFWNTLNDDSRALMSKSKLEINYQLSAPSHLKINIQNRFGSIYITELKAKTRIELSHGNLRANSLPEDTYINVSFGDVRIRNLRSGRLELKAAEVDIQTAGNLDINSSSSTIRIQELQNLRVDSRSDKELRIDQLKMIKGKILFSETILGEVTGEIDLETTYSDLRIDRLRFDVPTVDIRGKSSDINLTLSRNTYLDIFLEGNEEEMFVPIEFKPLDKQVIDEKKKVIRLTGRLGRESAYLSTVRIHSQGGLIDIRWDPSSEEPSAKENR